MTVRYAGSGDRVRMETSISTVALPGGMMVSLMDGGRHTMTLIMPSLATAMVSTLPVPRTPEPPTFSTNGPTVDTLASNEQLFGSAVMHVRIASTSTMTQHLGSMSCSRELESTTELFMVADPTIARIHQAMAKSLTGALSLPGSSILSPRPDLASLDPSKSAVRTIHRIGNPVFAAAPSVVMTTEVTEYKLGEIDAALLEVPPGYTTQDMRQSVPAAATDERMKQLVEQMFWRQFDSTAMLANGKKACVRSP